MWRRGFISGLVAALAAPVLSLLPRWKKWRAHNGGPVVGYGDTWEEAIADFESQGE